jgi:hypothetical protein
MNKRELHKALKSAADEVRPSGAEMWQVRAHNVLMQLFISIAKDRLRLVASVTSVDELDEEKLRRILEASFHGDARYASMGEHVYAVFLHRLSSLTQTELTDALAQVALLVKTFGSTYSCTSLRFEWPRPEPLNLQGAGGGVRRRTVEAVQESLGRMPQAKYLDKKEKDGPEQGDESDES